jgi:mannosyl-oligosaccharide alpha-1,2-mannosidase
MGPIDVDTLQKSNGDAAIVRPIARPVAPVGKKTVEYEHEVYEAPGVHEKKKEEVVVVPKQQSVEEVKNEKRRGAVVDAFKNAYSAYQKYCGDHDEVNPVSKKCRDWFHLGLTRIDALDTMILMGLDQETKETLDWLNQHFNLDQDTEISVFEGTIRILGGLLSAFDLTNDKNLLNKAKAFADRVMPAFQAYSSGIPASVINLKTGKTHGHSWLSGQVVLSEIGTLQMEFSYLAHHTNEPKYAQAVLNVFRVLRKNQLQPGLYATTIRPQDGSSSNGVATLNAPGDSMYEYLFKTWLLLGKRVTWLGDMWRETANAVLGKLRATSGDIVYLGSLSHNNLGNSVEQLACFAGGMFALASNHTESSEMSQKQLQFGKDFTSTCRQMYHGTASGLAPELVTISDGQLRFGGQLTFQLRPETIESLFYLYRMTNDQKYRDWAWEIFEAINKHCKVPSGGYTGVRDVNSSHPSPDDVQPSWFLAETLKYLFLIFSDHSVVPLDKYVFNTEAHPLSIFNPDPALYA